MIGTVDVVIAGDGAVARAAAVGALEHGQRVLLVLRSGDARVARRLRRLLGRTAGTGGGQLSVMTATEVMCVDGVNGVEAVVVRRVGTGHLSAVNASAFLSYDGEHI